MNGINYFTLSGLFFVLIAGAILAGYPSAVKDTDMETRTIYRSNPFARKNQIIREYEARVGFYWLILGAALQITGLLTRKGVLPWPCPTVGVIGCAAVCAVILQVTPVLLYKKISFPQFISEHIDRLRRGFEAKEAVLLNPAPGANILDTMKTINMVGRLLDVPRQGESDEQYLEKLRQLLFVKDSKKE